MIDPSGGVPDPPPGEAPAPRGRRRGRGHRWGIPPAILQEADEPFEGSHVLDELPGDAALLLWRALRDVLLWAAVPPARRGNLFSPGAGERRLADVAAAALEADIEVALVTLAAVPATPEEVHEEIVCLMCRQVSGWAEARGAWGTALTYAQAAALAAPTDAAAAYEVGRLALAWGRDARAETWLRRTVGVARRARAWEPYTRAYVDLGAVLERRGAHAEARRQLVRAYRAARRYGLLPLRAAALHGLMRVARPDSQGGYDRSTQAVRPATPGELRRLPSPPPSQLPRCTRARQ
jgi:tetratricopeptide (TPR) repeat protein